MLHVSRRGLICSLGALFVAPAIVRAESLMKVKPLADDRMYAVLDYGDFLTENMRYKATERWVATQTYVNGELPPWYQNYVKAIARAGVDITRHMMTTYNGSVDA